MTFEELLAFAGRNHLLALALVGITLLGEPANPGRLISIALIVAGVIGLKLATA